jgi:hypothetical protein
VKLLYASCTKFQEWLEEIFTDDATLKQKIKIFFKNKTFGSFEQMRSELAIRYRG